MFTKNMFIASLFSCFAPVVYYYSSGLFLSPNEATEFCHFLVDCAELIAAVLKTMKQKQKSEFSRTRPGRTSTTQDQPTVSKRVLTTPDILVQ